MENMTESSLKPYSISTTGADMTLELLSNKIDSKDIVVPEFQRYHVWPIAKASRLIESFLLGLPVPQVFLYQEPISRELLVVDGQQRLMAVNRFINGVYKGKEFRLSGVNSEWDGLTYRDLNDADRRRFNNTILRATIFEQVDPKDNTSIFEVFERLNTGGISLSAQEVRNAVIGGDFNQLAKELNDNATWRRMINKKPIDERQKDVEFIIRMLALLQSYTTYKKPMGKFLNTALSDRKTLSESDKQHYERVFIDTIELIDSTIGDKAFRPQSAVNIAVAEAVFIAVQKNQANKTLVRDVKAAYRQLITNQRFIDATTQHTTDADKVADRINIAIQTFKR